MAFSASRVSRTIAGNRIIEVWALNFAGVTSGGFKSGLSQVDTANFNNEVSEAQGLVKTNTVDGAAASSGGVHVSGVVASDTGKLTVIGY